MKQKLIYSALVLSALSMTIAIFSMAISIDQNKKVAYIRTLDLMQGYQGMIDAKRSFSDKELVWGQYVDSLHNAMTIAISQFKLDSASLSEESVESRKRHLQLMEMNTRKQTEEIAQQIQSAREKMTTGVLNQANDFLKKYGEKEGYVVILGTNNTGTLLYAKEAIDITDKALLALNDYYLSNI